MLPDLAIVPALVAQFTPGATVRSRVSRGIAIHLERIRIAAFDVRFQKRDHGTTPTNGVILLTGLQTIVERVRLVQTPLARALFVSAVYGFAQHPTRRRGQ